MLADLRSVRACTAFQNVISTTGPGLAAAPGEVAIEPVESGQRAHRRGVLGQPFELRLALGDEPARQRPEAVERGLRDPAPALGSQLELDLRPGVDLRLQAVRRGPHELGERGFQLARQSACTHGPLCSPSRLVLLLGAPFVAALTRSQQPSPVLPRMRAFHTTPTAISPSD